MMRALLAQVTMRLAAVGLALLAGCSAARSPAEQACEREANDSAAVQQLILTGLGNPYFQNNSQDELGAAKQQAFLACMRARGLAPKGGVERQKPLE